MYIWKLYFTVVHQINCYFLKVILDSIISWNIDGNTTVNRVGIHLESNFGIGAKKQSWATKWKWLMPLEKVLKFSENRKNESTAVLVGWMVA